MNPRFLYDNQNFFVMNLVYACNNAKYWAEKLL